jgi:putative chitinase
MRNAQEWAHILIDCHVKPFVAAKWGAVFAETVRPTSFSAGDKDLQDFLGQVLHESAGLTVLEENLNYGAQRLMAVWPKRFPTLAKAAQYAHNPERLANYVYAGRLGNTQPGDGWQYRGRGPIQVTGKDNYAKVGDLMGQDLINNPDLMAQPHYALEAAIAWWEDRIPDAMLGDSERVTTRVNGGLIGLADREQLTLAAGHALDTA